MFKAIITALAESGSKKKATASEPNTAVGNESKTTKSKKGGSKKNSKQNVTPKMTKTR